MAMNDCSRISGDFVAESELGPTALTVRAGSISLADDALRINLRGLDEEWLIGRKVGKIKINDATFALEEE